MIFGYMKIREKISHLDAYRRPELCKKHMGSKSPNGNIIVSANGHYNKFDKGIHEKRFDRIRRWYVIGDAKNSRMLDPRAIRSLAPNFIPMLHSILGTGTRAIDIISRYGRCLEANQVNRLLLWLADWDNANPTNR